MHRDLVFELRMLARLEGVTRSVLVKGLLIRLVNDHHRRTVIDAVGRYVDGPPPDESRRAASNICADTPA